MADPPSSVELSNFRVAVTYIATSACLASAWHVTFPHGLWVVNALASVVAIVLALWTLGGRFSASFGWSMRDLLWGLLLGSVMVFATQVLGRVLLPQLPPVFEEARRLYALLDTPPGPVRAAPIIWLVVIAEELVYRGVVTSKCVRGSTLRSSEAREPEAGRALLCSAGLYVLPLAASGSWLLVLIGVTVGTIWTVARLRSRGILISLVSHVMWSCSTFIAFPLI